MSCKTGRFLTHLVQLRGCEGASEEHTTLVGTSDGLVAFTHLWWSATGPEEDPFATDPAALHANRLRVLQIATLIVPGHGALFTPGETTPR